MDPTSTEESTPWDPITGKLRAHANLKLPKGTRDALAKHTRDFGGTQGLSSTTTRCPTTGATSFAASASTTAHGTPRRHSLADTLDLTTPIPKGAMRQSSSQPQISKNRSSSMPRLPGDGGPACGSGKRAVRFLADQRSPSRDRAGAAMEADPGRYDVDPSQTRRRVEHSPPKPASTFGSTGGMEYGSRQHIPAAMKASPAKYDVAPRGSKAAREYEDQAKHIMHVKADPRSDMLNDGTGRNADGDGQTMIGVEIKERFVDMKTAFLKIDADFDGRITHEELMQACLDWNIPLSEATRVMNCTDLDQKGFIDFDEFAQRFDPVLEVNEDDEELLRLYQEGIMGDEQPISLAGATHGTTTSDPFVDEGKHYRTENADLRGRLARSMKCIKDLQGDLKESRAHAAALSASLEDANASNRNLEGKNAELEGRNSVLRRKLEEAEEDKRRMARLLDSRSMDDDLDRTRGMKEDEERMRRARQRALEDEEEEAERRRLARMADRAIAEGNSRRQAEDESNTVFVYGIEGCQKTEALYKALEKAKVPFQCRDFNKDKRFEAALKKSGYSNTDPLFAPVVCLGGKAWWLNHEETQMVPFPQMVALELRRELGLNLPTPEKVREDVDIDTEIYERYLTMQEAFLKIDDNQDGFISEEELAIKCRFWNIPTSEATRIIREADKDGKGKIDFDEFSKRFDSLWRNGTRGPLRSQAKAPSQGRPFTSPSVAGGPRR